MQPVQFTSRFIGEKRRRAAALQDAGAIPDAPRTARSVLECASPLALWGHGEETTPSPGGKQASGWLGNSHGQKFTARIESPYETGAAKQPSDDHRLGQNLTSYARKFTRSIRRVASHPQTSCGWAGRHGRHRELFSPGGRNAPDTQETFPNCLGQRRESLCEFSSHGGLCSARLAQRRV